MLSLQEVFQGCFLYVEVQELMLVFEFKNKNLFQECPCGFLNNAVPSKLCRLLIYLLCQFHIASYHTQSYFLKIMFKFILHGCFFILMPLYHSA